MKLSLEVLRFVFFFFFFVNPSQTGYQKLVGAVFVYPISIEATRREGSTYTIICSRNLLGDRSLAVLLPPVLSPFFFFFCFISKLLFKTSLASLLLPHTLSSACPLRPYPLSLRSRLAVLPPFSLPTRPSDPSLPSAPFPLRHRLCRLKIPSGSNCSNLQQARLQTQPTDSCEPKMESWLRVN